MGETGWNIMFQTCDHHCCSADLEPLRHRVEVLPPPNRRRHFRTPGAPGVMRECGLNIMFQTSKQHRCSGDLEPLRHRVEVLPPPNRRRHFRTPGPSPFMRHLNLICHQFIAFYPTVTAASSRVGWALSRMKSFSKCSTTFLR